RPSDEQWQQAILRAQKALHAYGITAWQDAHLDARDVYAYRALKERGDLTAKVAGAHWWDRQRGAEQIADFDELRALPRLPGLDFSSVKVMVDGIIESGTATLVEPYRDVFADKARGVGFLEGDVLRELSIAIDSAGYQLHYHAVGDRAVRDALDACEAALAVNGARDSRHHIAHIELIHPDDIPRFARLGVVANMQPLWATNDTQMEGLRIPVLGEERSRWQFPFKSLTQTGARLAGGSDWAVSTADPLSQIAVAVTRRAPRPPKLEALHAEERLTVREAVDAFTSGSAFVNRLETSTGQIEVGFSADLALIDRNLLTAHPDELGEARNLLTMVDGEIVYADAAGVSW
ncbi:MAG: amidohydrolase, partial [Humibacter sp.]